MKKLYAIAAFLIAATTMSAQNLSLSTYNGTDLTKYDNQTLNVIVSRYMFKGWNTINLPFNMSAAQIDETFGSDCRLEKLVGVESNATNEIVLNFEECKSQGIKANQPYILQYNGETGAVKFNVIDALVHSTKEAAVFTANNGVTVSFNPVHAKTEAAGLYGILAKDNGEASFVNVDNITTGFYATRCFIQLSNGNQSTLTTNHFEEGEITSISSVVKGNELVDVFNISGVKVASKINAAEISNMNKGVYLIKGKKVLVK